LTERDNLPRWDGRRGRYEVWFLTLSDPDGRRGYWIRYALRAPIAGPPEPRLWFARFDREEPGRTFGIHGSPPGSRAVPEADGGAPWWGGARLEGGAAEGALDGGGHRVRWNLRWPTGQPTFRILPAPFYRGRLAPTRPLSPNPVARFTGTIEVDGDVEAIDGYPGQQGHLDGIRHAERWAWASCSAFSEDGYAFQVLSAQGRRGPFLTPFLTFAGLRVDGTWIRLQRTDRRNGWSLGRWPFRLASRSFRLEGGVRASPRAMIRARYLDPDDTPRYCHNTEVASCRLILWERGAAGGWRQVASLASDGTTHAEWAGRTPAPASMAEHVEVA
jgi:hypothetical protein